MKFKSGVVSGLVGLMVCSGLFASSIAVSYQEWRRIQDDRIDVAHEQGRISEDEARRMYWQVNHLDENRFNNTWSDWHQSYWQNHPNAWRWEENGQWVNGHYVGYPYPNDTLDDLRDILNHIPG